MGTAAPPNRTRGLLIAIGVLTAGWLGKSLVYDAYRARQAQISELTAKHVELEKAKLEYARLQRRWSELAMRTLPEKEVINQFDLLMKQLLARSKIEGPDVKTALSGQLKRTKIRRVLCQVNVQCELDRVIDFLLRLHAEPMLTRVSRLRLAPISSVGGGSAMACDMEVETLVFLNDNGVPRIPQTRMEDLVTLEPLDHPIAADHEYARIWQRNIFAAFEPPPTIRVRVTNDDRLALKLHVQSWWEGKVRTDKQFEVAATTKRFETADTFEGDRVELTATYADGSTYKPKEPYRVRQRFTQGVQWWELTVPAHSPPPPPTDIEVQVVNQDEAAIDVTVEVEIKGKMVKLAPIKVAAGATSKLEKWESPRVRLTALYEGGGATMPKEFTPAAPRPMVWTVPQKPIGTPTTPAQVAQPAPPASPDLRVTALWSECPDGPELIGTHVTTKERKVFKVKDALDGGELIAVHPLGGVLQMPNGEFYLYPYGLMFTERVVLAARNRDEIPAAIRAYRDDPNVKSAATPIAAAPQPTPTRTVGKVRPVTPSRTGPNRPRPAGPAGSAKEGSR